jgi:hypothetical protein
MQPYPYGNMLNSKYAFTLQKTIAGIMVGIKLQIHVEVYLGDLRFHLFHATIHFYW